MNTTHDLIIVGGGIAGMTAAIYAARANLKTLLLEKSVCGGLVNSTHVVENFPSYLSINGMDLMEKVRDQIEELGVEVIEVVELEAFDLTGATKVINTDEGVFSAQAIILASGRHPKRLPVETDLEQIHYCAICDGTSYKDKSVLVVGGGNSGVDESLYLLSLGVKQLTLIEECGKLFASETACSQLRSHANVNIMTSTKIDQFYGTSRLEGVALSHLDTDTTSELQVDGIFVYIGQEPQTKQYKGQVELDSYGYLKVDEAMQTSLSGVYGAGDVVQKKFRQITTAMNDGTIAALSAVEFLNAARRAAA